VVIVSLTNTRDEAFTNKVPFLGDIPLIGAAFRYDSRTTRRVELLVFLTPRVVGGPCDEETIKEVEMGRLHYIESEAEELHGPLRSLPAPDQIFDEKGQPWNGPGKLVPGSTSPSLDSAPQLPPPPVPKVDDSTAGSAVIRDSAVGPASASRLRYTEEDDAPTMIQQAKSETVSSKPRRQTKPPAKSGLKGWSGRN
jgi:general secretion pathway protein D